MKRVSELYGKYPDSDIYVVGSGASMRVFPTSFLRDKITIGLNMAWRSVPVRYAITIHPELNIPDFLPGDSPRPITWITAHEKCRGALTPDQLAYAEANFYFFEYHGRPNTQPSHEPSDAGRVVDWVHRPTGDYLYVWSSISQAGVNLAANMGARNVVLVGCDNASLLGNHHANAQHTRWKGVAPEYRYRQYREGLVEIREALKGRGVNLVSVSPFLGLDSAAEEFSEMCARNGTPLRVPSRDISPGILMRVKQHPAGRLARKVARRLFPWGTHGTH